MTADSGESVDFYVLEETRINGANYLLVTDAPEDEDGECYILKDVSEAEDPEAVYEFVEDEKELDAVFSVFEKLLEDADSIRRERSYTENKSFHCDNPMCISKTEPYLPHLVETAGGRCAFCEK